MMSWSRIASVTRMLRWAPSRHSSSVSKTNELKVLSMPRKKLKEDDAITDKDFVDDKEPNILSPDLGTNYDFSDYGPELGNTQTFAGYANKSSTLQKLVDLGVDFFKLEQREKIPTFLFSLDFDRDVAKYIQFFTDIGVPAEDLGLLFTRNPYLLLEDIESMQKRIDYLLHLKFEFKDLERLVCANPKWLSFKVEQMQKKVDYIRRKFSLTEAEFREVALISPKFVTYSIQELEANTFSIREEMGFKVSELKAMLMCKPRVWLLDNKSLVERFHFLHNSLKIPHALIAKQPQALLARLSHLRQRHAFLHSLGKAQYDPLLPNYVSLLALVQGSNAEFASNVAGSSHDSYSLFLKTL